MLKCRENWGLLSLRSQDFASLFSLLTPFMTTCKPIFYRSKPFWFPKRLRSIKSFPQGVDLELKKELNLGESMKKTGFIPDFQNSG
jgi:hypothetical protein